jgi:ATP-binding cassette subfamily B protein
MKVKDNIKKITSYYKPYKKILFFDLLFAVISSAVVLAIPLIVRYITETVIYFSKDQAITYVLWLGAAMLALLAINFGCEYFMTYYGHLMGAKIERDMRSEIFDHYQELSLNFYDNQKIGQLMSRITVDLNNISELLHHAPEETVVSGGRIIIAFVIFFILNYKLAFILLGLFLIIVVFTCIFMPKMNKAFLKNHQKVSEINAQVEDTLSGIRVVKSFANEDLEIKKFENKNKEFLDSKRETFTIMSIFYPGMMTFITSLVPAIVVAGVLYIINYNVSISDLITFLLYEDAIVGPIFGILNLVEQFQESAAGYKRFVEILDVKPEICDKPDAVELKNVKGNIAFHDVSFKYEKSNKNIFSDINLNIKGGDYVAIVGASGMGKSTLCSLIARFYDVTGGSITIDGIDIRNVKLKNLRDNIGMVQQDIYLFADTIYENIRYGKPDATREEVVAAAKKAYANDFIMNFTDGYETQVGQKGSRLSGGQKQRISIARVFLKDPPILILDEATSSLDNESEKLVQLSFEKLALNRTTIVIAHRLTTIENARTIVTLDKNGIEEYDSHEELLSEKGSYENIYETITN